jgi:hypothetical protein
MDNHLIPQAFHRSTPLPGGFPRLALDLQPLLEASAADLMAISQVHQPLPEFIGLFPSPGLLFGLFMGSPASTQWPLHEFTGFYPSHWPLHGFTSPYS